MRDSTLTAQEAGARLGLTAHIVRKMVRQGILEGTRVGTTGRMVRVMRHAVDALVPEGDELLNVFQVADRLRLHYNTVYNMIDRGELEEVRLSQGRVRVRRSELERYLSRPVSRFSREHG